ncbi:mRNA cap guanine-N7 methyltransferase [Melipona quadrifasciata]|uniref:mRNA cap guanine-N(7) methyltransferase n=1 Tax=Melipona quadrifasciata TaxID=166423 RepID=A0A0N0BHL0_9HYME|nr:mRNA cap guanine-N7 methyltransferase [Melipona quadrifasciata]
MNEAKEKRDEISKEKDKNYRQNKRSQIEEHSSDASSSKRVKYDTAQNVNNTSSELSSNNSEKRNESLSKKEHSDNSLLVIQHYNTILDDRKKSRILYMRNFNNWIKSMLMFEYTNEIYGTRLKALDMCCGRGGDLTIQECQDRYNEMLKQNSAERKYSPIFTAEFITADCTKVRLRSKFEDPSINFDLVSCQFAFHYCFESLEQAECMLKNASECLKPGGYFIGTIPDAYDLVWQRCDGNSFGNDIYNVEFFCNKTKPPLFGAKYHFKLGNLVNCPEFLVYLPVFRKLALKFGLNLVKFERFDSFYERMKNKKKGKHLLKKIQALETYPSQHGEMLAGNPDKDYQHAKEYNTQKTSNRREIGTLSQPEWEVIC